MKHEAKEITSTIQARHIRGYPDLMTVKDIQDILHIGRSTAYKLLQSGELRTLRIGSIYRIPKAYLTDFINNNS